MYHRPTRLQHHYRDYHELDALQAPSFKGDYLSRGDEMTLRRDIVIAVEPDDDVWGSSDVSIASTGSGIYRVWLLEAGTAGRKGDGRARGENHVVHA